MRTGAQRELPRLREIKKRYDQGELIAAFCRIAKVDRDYICTRGKNTTDRAILMEMLYRHCRITQPEIGCLAGGIDYSSMS